MKKNVFFLMLAIGLSHSLLGQTKIVCMGNSITQGKISRGFYQNTEIGDSLAEMSYRFWLWEKLDADGLSVEFTGSWNKYFEETTTVVSTSRYTGHQFANWHESYYGIKTGGFLNGGYMEGHGDIPPLDERLANYDVDVALIHLGTNDSDTEDPLPEENLKSIVSTLRAKNPNVTVLLARLITDWKPVSIKMPEIAKELTKENSIVYCVDMATGFVNDPENANAMTFDWVHPNPVGQKLMAQRWYDAFNKVRANDAQPPSAPTGLSSDNITANGATVEWTKSTDNIGVNVYKVYVNNLFYAETAATQIDLEGIDVSAKPGIKISAVDYQKNESTKSDELYLETGSVSINSVQNSNEDRMKIYPVPAKNTLSVATVKNEKINSFKIFDLSGKLIKSHGQISDSIVNIPVYDLDAGTYLLELSTDQGTMAGIFMIQR